MANSRLALIYAALVGAPIGVCVAVLAFGRTAGTAAPAAVPRVAEPGFSHPALLIAQIAVTVLAARAVGSLAQRIRQPRVIGEVLAGILLGPSFLGWMAPSISTFLFPPSGLGALNAISQLGLVLFLFMVGLEVNLEELREQGSRALLISHASIAAPMALGTLLALYLYPRVSEASVEFSAFVLFLGTAMSVTAFPVLARILSESRLLQTRMGSMAIACAGH